MRDLNNKEIKKLLNSKFNYIGIEEGYRKVIIYECEKHGHIKQRFDVHIKNLTCPKCSKYRDGIYTLEYINKLKEQRDIKYIYDIEKGKIYTSRDKIKIICDIHGTFEQNIHNHFNIGNNCPECSNRKKIKITEIVENIIKKKNIEILKFNGYRKMSIFICKIHGEFKSGIETTKRHGCPKCAKENKNLKEKNKFIEKSSTIWHELIKFDYKTMEYNGTGKKMRLFSKETGWIKQLPCNHLLGFIPKSSTGELIIENLLKSKGIKYIKEKKFEKCINIRQLRFDFYLPDKNICIEFNGIQHYKPISLFGGEKTYLYQMKNDNIKKEFCEKNGIQLLVIPYNESIIKKLNEL